MATFEGLAGMQTLSVSSGTYVKMSPGPTGEGRAIWDSAKPLHHYAAIPPGGTCARFLHSAGRDSTDILVGCERRRRSFHLARGLRDVPDSSDVFLCPGQELSFAILELKHMAIGQPCHNFLAPICG
jgi:hypothetical protein